VDLITGPPPAGATAAMEQIAGVRIFPTVLNTQSGPDGDLGPESAEAILVLQGTFTDRGKFEEFWDDVVDLMRLLATAPGFIRRCNFADGPHYTLIGWWRTVADAQAFFDRPEHQAAMHRTFERRWNYTHFAGLWQTAAVHRRMFFCQVCDAVISSTAADPATRPTGRCTRCGSPLDDPLGGHHVRPAAADLPR
jgi:heme-degrading monooxygenase HmoA